MEVSSNSSTANSEKKKRLHIGLFQWAAILGTLTYGVREARLTGLWYTFAAAAVGVLCAWLRVAAAERLLVCRSALAVSGKIFVGLSSALNLLARNLLSEERYPHHQRAGKLYGFLWREFNECSPVVAARIKICVLLESPLIYIRWAFVGILVHAIYGVHNGEIFAEDPLLLIDLPFAGLMMVSAMSRRLKDIEWRSLRLAERQVNDYLADRLSRLTHLKGKREHEFQALISEMRTELGKRSYKIGKFLSNGCAALDGVFNLIVLLGVLFWISPGGGFLATIAVLVLAPILYHDAEEIKKAEDETGIPRAELAAMERFTQDSRVQRLLYTIAKPQHWAGYLAGKRRLISSVINQMLVSGDQRAAVMLGVFFTIYSFAAAEPISAALSGELNIRLTLLFIFSIHTIWGTLPRSAERLNENVEFLDEMKKIEELPEILAQTREDDYQAGSGLLPPARPSSQIRLDNSSARYQMFRPTIFQVDGELETEVTVSLSKDVKVVGDPGTGTSTLLKLIAGEIGYDPEITADAGSVRIGEFSTAEFDLGRSVLLVPDEPPDFSGVKIRELFLAICGPQMSDTEMERILRDVGLLQQIKFPNDAFSGLNLLVGYGGRHLTPQQRHLLFLALNLAAMKYREGDPGFDPSIIAIDGIADLGTLELRRSVAKLFKRVCDDTHATFVVVVRDQREIAEDDYVLTMIPLERLPEDLADRHDCTVVVGGKHGEQWTCLDKVRREIYREEHAVHAACL